MNKKTLVFKTPLELELILKIEPVLESLGYCLRDLELSGMSNGILRIFLESPKSDQPIGIEDCVKAHETLSPLLDLWDPIEGAYTLEISSPGEKPPLRCARHFQEALGKRLRFQTTEPLPMPAPAKPRKRWDGLLKDLNLESETGLLILEDEWGVHKVPLSKITQSEVFLDWNTNKR